MIKWQTLGSKLIHKNPYLNLRSYEVVRPNGIRAPFYVVERPNFTIIIPLLPRHETYLVGQYRYSMSYYSWEFPMGAVEGKPLEEMAKIELKEETGLTANKYLEIGAVHVAHGFLKQKAHVFIAEELTSGQAEPEINEFLQMKKVTLLQVGEMISQGKIVDGPTICAYHFLEIYLKNNSTS